MRRYHWSGISTDERMKAIAEISDIVSSYGTIINFQRFSDISLNLVLDIKESKLTDLRTSLTKIMSLEDMETSLTDSIADCTILLNIIFTKGTGDLEIEIPDIPK